MVAKLDSDRKPIDFAALEVQAVYFSGNAIRPAFNHFLKHGSLPEDSRRRPDYRSSAQKRLVPQLNLKVPVFRRWGKKVFVAVDSHFFNSLPQIQTVESIENSEVTWLVYSFSRKSGASGFVMNSPIPVFTQWEDVVSALREGEAPDPAEIIAEIHKNFPRSMFFEI